MCTRPHIVVPTVFGRMIPHLSSFKTTSAPIVDKRGLCQGALLKSPTSLTHVNLKNSDDVTSRLQQNAMTIPSSVTRLSFDHFISHIEVDEISSISERHGATNTPPILKRLQKRRRVRLLAPRILRRIDHLPNPLRRRPHPRFLHQRTQPLPHRHSQRVAIMAHGTRVDGFA